VRAKRLTREFKELAQRLERLRDLDRGLDQGLEL
jgi:hypothetical protein